MNQQTIAYVVPGLMNAVAAVVVAAAAVVVAAAAAVEVVVAYLAKNCSSFDT